MTATAPRILRTDRPDGSILLQQDRDLGPFANSSNEWLERWAAERPDAVFLAERSGAGWQELGYGVALEQVRALAAGLLARGLNETTPVLILSGNSINHALLALAAQYVGIPVVPVAEQYALIPGAQAPLHFVIAQTAPGLVFAEDGSRFAAALEMAGMAGRQIVVGRNPGPGMALIGDLEAPASAGLDLARAAVGPETVAKVLMTSGSLSAPKGVITTQAMMCANQAQFALALPFLEAHPPRLVDWLPWSHVFGGSNNFNLVLAHGGSLYIDPGKPTADRIGESIAALKFISPTIAFNVPAGFALLRDAMRDDAELRAAYFRDLDMLFYAGAPLPADVWEDLAAMAQEVRGKLLFMTTCWGMTETAPGCVFQHAAVNRPGQVGVPLAGVTAKLVPDGSGRMELRVKGPNVTPGYYRQPSETAAAFDDEGFLRTGDAMQLAVPEDPQQGLVFDGRMGEDFKLASGTWVRAGALRAELLDRLQGLAADAVITGEGQAEAGALIVPAEEAAARMQRDGGALTGAAVMDEIATRLADQPAGSSRRVARVLVLADPPSVADGEVTAKGSLNARALLDRRQTEAARLFSEEGPAVLRIEV
ncbi:AMP-binding protein [Roseobacteraceae bacterium NS-SX3]